MKVLHLSCNQGNPLNLKRTLCMKILNRKVSRNQCRGGQTSYGNVRHVWRYGKSTHATCAPIATICATGSRKRTTASTRAFHPITRRDSAALATFASTIKIVVTSVKRSLQKSKATMRVPKNLRLRPLRIKILIKFKIGKQAWPNTINEITDNNGTALL